jgi:hypothetical protein
MDVGQQTMSWPTSGPGWLTHRMSRQGGVKRASGCAFRCDGWCPRRGKTGDATRCNLPILLKFFWAKLPTFRDRFVTRRTR